MDGFDIPVVLFTFKRDKIIDVIRRVAIVRPKKIYILSDHGRNDEEKRIVDECRQKIEKAIDWDCEIIKNYADENRGVYENIGEGAKWVLKREKHAIFLEDDNLPEVSFFDFCKQMLLKYENDEKILWICGTNYLGKYKSKNNESYMFTRHMLPCGWASWSHKFLKFYDGEIKNCEDEKVLKKVKKNYLNTKLFNQYKNCWQSERKRIKKGMKPISWDYQMDFVLKFNGLYGICPKYNQIKNIGVDSYSIHGGDSFQKIMTKRFCGMDSYELESDYVHPQNIKVDMKFERKIGKIILYPLRSRLQTKVSKIIRFLFGVPEDKRIKDFLFKKEGKNGKN